MSKIKVIADQQIPFLSQLLTDTVDLSAHPTEQISQAILKDADVLIVRSVTRVTRQLIDNTAIKLVCSATSGHEHIDKQALASKNIAWTHAPGCNRIAVAEYVITCIASLQQQGFLTKHQPKIGIIGLGHTGSAVAERLQALDFPIICYDPPKALQQSDFHSATFAALHDCDLLTLHTPLHDTPPYPSYHLIDHAFLAKQKPGTVIINAARGDVLSEAAMLAAPHCHYCLDVYHNEPNINPAVLAQAILATPHIAGHSVESKWQGSYQVCQAIKRFFQLPILSATMPDTNLIIDQPELANWRDIVLATYDPNIATTQLKTANTRKQTQVYFKQLRRQTTQRHHFTNHQIFIKNLPESTQNTLKKLGFQLKP